MLAKRLFSQATKNTRLVDIISLYVPQELHTVQSPTVTIFVLCNVRYCLNTIKVINYDFVLFIHINTSEQGIVVLYSFKNLPPIYSI